MILFANADGFSKDHASIFKSLVINYFILKYRHTF